MGLGSELVDWYRDATSVQYGQLMIDLSPRTDDRLSFCTNTACFRSKFYIPERLKHSKSLDDEHTKSLHSPNAPIVSPQMQKSSFSRPKKVYQVSLRRHSKSAQRKPAKHKKTSCDKISEGRSIALFEKNNLEAKEISGIPKRFTVHESYYSSRH